MGKHAKRSKRRKSIGSGRKGQDLRKGYQTEDRDIQRYHADARDRESVSNSKENDWSWYAQSPQLIRDYASYPFGVPLGSRFGLDGIPGLSSNGIPGIMTLEFCPTIGEKLDPNSPVNIASRNIYSFVRHANSGHSNYEAPDLMIYLLAMDSVYMYRSFLTRLLGILNAYTPVNRYYPSALVAAMGVNFNDVVKHIPDLRGYVNQLGVKMGSMCVPSSMPYFARHSWMCEGYYVDSNTTKAQTYMYVPVSYLKTKLNTKTSLIELTTTRFISGQKSFDALVEFGDSLINPILANEDFNIMSGDILKAFGVDGVIKVATIPDGYLALPAYNQEVQSQIENATVLGAYPNFVVSQNVQVGQGYLIATSSMSSQSGAGLFTTEIELDVTSVDDLPSPESIQNILDPIFGARHILNFHMDNVTPEATMVATRLSNITHPGFIETYTFSGSPAIYGLRIYHDVPTMGSEVVCQAKVWYYNFTPNGNVNTVSRNFSTKMPIFQMRQESLNVFKTNYMNTTTTAAYASMFDWSPQVYPSMVMYTPKTTAGAESPEIWGPAGVYLDIDNYTLLDELNLRNMSLAALLSEFNVPQMGAFSNK